MTISLCLLVKNESQFLGQAIKSISDHCNEIIVVDDHSEDETKKIATTFGAKVYDLPWHVQDKGFAASVNFMLDQATSEWIFLLDADEQVSEAHKIHELVRYSNKNVFALPRRKWENFSLQKRTEIEAYPDWQIRFFRNTKQNRFTGEMHIRMNDTSVDYAFRGPHIEHLQQECRSPQKIAQRAELYPGLAEQQGVAVDRGYVLENKD